VARCQADGELLVTGSGEPAHALDEFIDRARRGQVANQPGGEEVLLLGTRADVAPCRGEPTDCLLPLGRTGRYKEKP